MRFGCCVCMVCASRVNSKKRNHKITSRSNILLEIELKLLVHETLTRTVITPVSIPDIVHSKLAQLRGQVNMLVALVDIYLQVTLIVFHLLQQRCLLLVQMVHQLCECICTNAPSSNSLTLELMWWIIDAFIFGIDLVVKSGKKNELYTNLKSRRS